MSNKHQSESGRRRSERRKHDREARDRAARMDRPWHASPAVRYAFIVLAVVVIVGITFLFIGGVIHW